MDSKEDVSSLKRKSTLELSTDEAEGLGRKSSRVHAIASVRAATSKLSGSAKVRTEQSPQKAVSKQRDSIRSISLTKSASKTSLTKSTSKTSLTKSTSKTSLTKSTSKTSLTKSTSKVSLTKSASKSTSLTKPACKTSLTKSASKTSLTKSASKTSLTKSASKTSLTKSASKTSLSKSASTVSLTKSSSKAGLAKSTSNASLTHAASLKSRLSSKESSVGGKKLWFPRGCHVAVFAQGGSRFYLCRLQQNVFNSSKEVKVRWLSVAGVRFYPNMYKMSYIDKVDPASILMQVDLTQTSRLRYLLPSDQEQEIENMVRLVEDVQSGKVSIQDIDDDVQEVVQIDEPPPKKPRLVKSASQRIREKALKGTPKKSSQGKKVKGKEPKEKKEKKEPKRKVPQKVDELKLNPRPNFKVLDEDPLFESREPMPYISKASNSKLVYRAINLGDSAMLRKLLKDGRKIKNLYSMSVSNDIGPIHCVARNMDKEVFAVLVDELVDEKFAKRYENNPDDVTNLDRMNTGTYNQKSLAVSRVRRIQASRGTKEGNNAFLHRSSTYRTEPWFKIANILMSEGISPRTVDEFENHFKKLKPDKADSFVYPCRRYHILTNLLMGQNKLAGRALKRLLNGKHIVAETLMTNVLLFDDEDLTQCPPSAVKEICKAFDKITAIHCAAANPNSKYLKKLLSVHPDAQVPDGSGRRPIHFAAGCRSPDNLKLLLSWRVNTQDTSSDMMIPLHYAIVARRSENVAILIDHDRKGSTTDPNVMRYGRGGVNRPMKNSLMPLHMAAQSEDLDIARILLSNGASVNAVTSVENMKRTPLQIAAGTGNLEMVKLLVDHGAIVEQKDRLGRTPLLIACMNGATKVLSYFLHIGANPENVDTSDNTPLHYAAAYGWYFTVKMLMDIGVEPNPSNMWKISPLYVAYMKGHVGIVRQLLSYNTISLNQVLHDGSTLLFHACQSDLSNGDVYEQIEYMVKEKGAVCDIKDSNGKTALFYLACATLGDQEQLAVGQQQCIKIATLLLDNGCDIGSVDENGFTALMETMANVKNTTLADFLVKKGCQVFAPADGERKSTILHAICKNFMAAGTGLTKMMEIMKQPKYIKAFREMAKCYDKDGYTPLLQLVDENIYYILDSPRNPTENEKQYLEFVKFLVDVLQSPINAVVIKKYLSPDEVVPPENSDDWYTNPEHAGCNALIQYLKRVRYDTSWGSENEHPMLTAIQYLVKKGIDVNTVDRKGDTALSMCVKTNLPQPIRFLGKHGTCDVDYEIKDGPRTVHPLHICRSIEEIEALLDIGCNPNAVSKEDKYTTFLHRLILGDKIRGNRDAVLRIVEKLILNESNGGHAFDFNIQDWRGRTVLHQLARQNPGTLSTSLELEFKVIQKGGKVGMQDKKGRTPLHYVFKPKQSRWSLDARSPNMDATQLTQMISKCMTAEEINAKDYRGKTALHMAAQIGASVSCVTLMSLGKRKADISAYDKDGNTALTLAVLNSQDACAVSLIQSSASLTDNVIEWSKRENERHELRWKESYYKGEEDEEDEDDESKYWTIEATKHLKRPERMSRIPLYKAAMKNGLQGVAMLVSQADPHQSGCTPMDIIKMAFDECHYNIALEILYNQWNSGQLRKLDENGRNLLHLLAISCRKSSKDEDPLVCKVANFLIREKMPVEQKDKFGLYPIHWAIIEHHFDLANLLAEHGTSFDKDANGRCMSYLEAALWRIYSKNGMNKKVWEFLDKLGDKGMDWNRIIKIPLYPELFSDYLKGNKKDPELSQRHSATSTTALIIAIRSTVFRSNYVANFLVSGASPNVADGNHVTPMMHAVMKNDAEFVSLLLNYEYPECMKEKPNDSSSDNKKKKLNTSIFRLKPQDDESESEEDDESESEKDEKSESEEEEDSSTETKKDEKELKPVPKTSDVDLDAKDKDGRTALHYVACPDPNGTFDNAKIAFLLVKAGAKELKDKAGMTPYALAVKKGALDVATMLKSLGHGKKDNIVPNFDRHFPVNDGIIFKPSLCSKPDFRNDAQRAVDEEMEVDRHYEHVVDTNCSVMDGTLMKDEEQDIWYDVLLTKVDVKRSYYAAYNFYKMQLVQQSNPSLFVLFTCWGCIGTDGQFQHTPFSDVAAAAKEFCKIFRSKTGNKWTDVKNFEIKPKKYRLLDDASRLAPPKMDVVDIDVTSKAHSTLPNHLKEILDKMMNPKGLVQAMERIKNLSLESLPFGRLSRERLQKGKRILMEIKELVSERNKILSLDEEERVQKDARHFELSEKMAELSNEYFHTIPQKDFVYESICPVTNDRTVMRHIQAVDNLLDYEIACQMLKGAMTCKADIHPADYVYRCLDCKLELMQKSDPMTQLILKYIHTTSSADDKITGIFKVSREGESARLEKTGLENRRLLFHGTGVSNLLSILSRGLVTIFPEHGAAYGHGIYFSDHFSKSRNYSDGLGIMFLCEVALGKPHCLKRYENLPDDQELDEVFTKNGCSSLVTNGHVLENWFKLPSGMSINLNPSSNYYSPEFVVLKPDQVCIRYLIKFEHVI